MSQVVDTTKRQASEERRELISHTTRVENIISLLPAKYVGTPHLSFSVSPQPLQQLSIDPSDPNLWFQQLLARRSSGIEGIQEFTAVIVVPEDTDFCINARLRRVCLLDSPPGPFSLDERFTGTLLQLSRMVNYLNDAFPIGTPLEELDIDIIGGLTPAAPSAARWSSCGGCVCWRAWLWRPSFRPAPRPASRRAAGRTTSTFSKSGSTRCATSTNAKRRVRRSSAACFLARTASSTPASAPMKPERWPGSWLRVRRSGFIRAEAGVEVAVLAKKHAALERRTRRLAFVLVAQRVEPDFEKVLVVCPAARRDARRGARRNDGRHDQALEQAQPPQLDHRPAEGPAGGQAADDVDVELFERRADRERVVEVVDHPGKLHQRAGEAFVEAERPRRAVEQTHAAQSRADAEIRVLGHDNDRGEFLDALDAAGTARQQLLEPQVRVRGVDRKLLQGLGRHREAQVWRAHVFRGQQRDDVLDARGVADQFAPLFGGLAVGRVDDLRHRTIAGDVGGRVANRATERDGSDAESGRTARGQRVRMAAQRFIHLRAALADRERIGLAFVGIDADDPGLHHAAVQRRGGVEVRPDRAEIAGRVADLQVEQHVHAWNPLAQEGCCHLREFGREFRRRDRCRELDEDEPVVGKLARQRLVVGLEEEERERRFRGLTRTQRLRRRGQLPGNFDRRQEFSWFGHVPLLVWAEDLGGILVSRTRDSECTRGVGTPERRKVSTARPQWRTGHALGYHAKADPLEALHHLRQEMVNSSALATDVRSEAALNPPTPGLTTCPTLTEALVKCRA